MTYTPPSSALRASSEVARNKILERLATVPSASIDEVHDDLVQTGGLPEPAVRTAIWDLFAEGAIHAVVNGPHLHVALKDKAA